MKRYKIKLTLEILKKLKYWWKIYHCIEDEYWEAIKETEEKMAKDTGIEDIEFFHTEGMACGIGNISRTMKLVQENELEI